MVVSFRIFEKGTRYKPIPSTKAENGGNLHNSGTGKFDGDLSKRLVDDNDEEGHGKTCTTYSVQLELPEVEEYDISFMISLFQDGYLVRKSTEIESFHTLQQDDKSLHPYDKASEALFSAIQSGLLPGDILDDIASSYINGAIVCEIRDYRKSNLEEGSSNYASGGCAISKVHLRMSLENVVKDITQLADDSWTYGDLLEVESGIVKAMHPQLYLSPAPKLDRLFSDPCPYKLNVGIERKRPSRNPEIAVTTMRKRICGNGASNTNKLNSKDHGIVPSSALILSVQDTGRSLFPEYNNFAQPPLSRSTLFSQPQRKIHVSNFSGANTSVFGARVLSGSYNDNVNSIRKREKPDSQMPMSNSLKRAKPSLYDLDGIQQKQFNTQLFTQNIQDVNVKNQVVRSQFEVNRTQYNASRHPSSSITSKDTKNFYFSQQGMGSVKIEQIDPMSSPLPSTMQWPNSNKDVSRKDDLLQKKGSFPSPRIPSGIVRYSESLKSGEIFNGSGALGSQKATMHSNAAIGRAYAASGLNDSAQTQRQTQLKSKANSASKTQIMSGVGYPPSVNTMHASLSAASPSTRHVPLDDQRERFAKIAMLTQRFLANTKRKKVDQFPTKRNFGCPNHYVASCLNDAFGAEDYIDEMKPMSTSFVGGNINTCKARVMIFSHTESNQDRTNRRLCMTEKQSDGTVLMQYGDADGPMFPSLDDSFLVLPNVHYADLLAAQFTKLTVKEKYQKTDDQVHPLSFYACELQKSAQGQPLPNMLAMSYSSSNSKMNPQMLASRNNPVLPMVKNYFSRAQHLGKSSLQQQLPHQQQQPQQQLQSQLQVPQLPRTNSPMLMQNPSTQLMGPNANLGSLNLNSLMTNMTTAQKMHLLMHQQLPQDNPMHVKMMLEPNNMGNLGMVGPGSSINNAVGVSCIKPMQLMSQDQAAEIQRMKMQQSRMGAELHGGIPYSMFGPAANRLSLSTQLQRNAMASMGLPKVPQKFYEKQMMTPRQITQQQVNSQQLSSQLSQQQPISSPFEQQHAQTGSPSVAMSPQQKSNGSSTNNMNDGRNIGGNVGVLGSGSPQLDPHTHGSVESVTSSPMDMQDPK